MALIGNLLVNLGMRTAAFEAGAKRSTAALRNIERNVQQTTATFRRLAGAIAGVWAIRRAAGMFLETARSLDEVSKASRRVGVDAGRLIGLQRAADLSGVSASALATSMRELQRRSAESATGAGSAARAFADLGLSAREMAALPVDAQMVKIADAMANVTNENERVRISMDLFGRSGEGMINVLEQGSGWLERMMQSMEGVATAEQFANVEKMVDAFTNMGNAVKDLRERFVLAVSQGLERFANSMTNLIKRVSQWSDAAWRGIGHAIHFAAALFAITKIAGPIITALRGIAAIKTLLIAKQTTLLALAGPSGWVTIAAGIGIAAMSYMVLEDQVSSLMRTVENSTAAVEEFKGKAEEAAKVEVPTPSLPALEAADRAHQQRQSLRQNVGDMLATARQYENLARTSEEWEGKLQGIYRNIERFEIADWLANVENRMKYAQAAATGMTADFWSYIHVLHEVDVAHKRIELEKHIEKMREQNRVLAMVASTGMEAARAQFVLAGATAEQLAEYDRLESVRRYIEHMEEVRTDQQDFADSIQRVTDRLREQIDTYGMSARAAELWRLHRQGATTEEIANIADLMQRLDELDERQRRPQDTPERTLGEARVIDRARVSLEGLRMMGSDRQPMQQVERKIEQTNAILERIYRERGLGA